MDLISCIITTYKRPISILKRAIDSIVSQTYKNIELIIVNDAPQDTELEEEIKNLLDEYKTIPIVYIVNNKNMGACYSRNAGITKARGKFIAFLDDDDEWLPTKLKKQYELMIKADVDLVYCSHYEVYRNGKIKLIEECLSKEGKNTDDFEEFILETKKIFLRYDFNKSERPNHSKQLSYMKSILKDNEIEFSTKVVKGNFDDNISYDYIIGNYGFKLFSFDGKKIKNLTSTAYKWAFIADEMNEKYKTVFIYDIKLDNDKNYNIIMRILSSKTNVDIISLNDILSYTKRIAPSQLEWKDIV